MGKIIPLGGVIMVIFEHYCVGSGGHNRMGTRWSESYHFINTSGIE